MKFSTVIALAVPALLAATAAAQSLRVYPEGIHLRHQDDRSRIVALLVATDGRTKDVTDAVKWNVSSPVIAIAGGVCRPKKPGKATLSIIHGKLETTIPVVVAGVDPQNVSFTNDVIPVLTRQGCNAGSCHGAASGKNGFRLSLFGYDAALDHRTLTRELRGRRANPAEPATSLMLTKPSGGVAHKGGKVFDPEHENYLTMLDWIRAGVPDDSKAAPTVTSLEVWPSQAVLDPDGAELPLIVTAGYSDGSSRDVTELALLSSNNEPTLKIQGDRIVAAARGEATVMARFGPMATIAQFLVVPATPFQWPDAAKAVNYVDERIHDKLRRVRIAPADLCDDATFVRRLYVDLLNRPPTEAEARAFLDEPATSKRAQLVDALLERPEFAETWAMTWAEILQVRQQRLGDKGVTLARRFLREAFRGRRPFDAVVRDILGAQGDTYANPATSFYAGQEAANILAERAAQSFLGIRIQCAQCHDHPFENWTMDDYYGFSAFFSQVGRKLGSDGYQFVVWDRRYGEIRHKRTGANAIPTPLGGEPNKIPYGTDRRKVLADWLTAKDNRMFSESIANRVWARVMGRGIVDPPDDIRISNPPSHPLLLQELGRRFADSGFDIRQLVRDLCLSRTYQLASHGEAVPNALFAGSRVRRLSAEQLLDGIDQVTGVPTRHSNAMAANASATEIEGEQSNSRFLDVFGRPDRQSACTCDRRMEPTLGQALHLINGDTLQSKITSGSGKAAKLAKSAPEPHLEQLFLAAYSRRPKDAERDRLLKIVAEAGDDPRSAWQDIYWAVLNSKEFLFQH